MGITFRSREIAAIRHGKTFVGIEPNPEYQELAKRKLLLTTNEHPQPDATNREIAKLDALERWNVGPADEWPTALTADAIRSALKQQAADNDWMVPDIHQLEADVEVILDYLCDAELEHMG